MVSSGFPGAERKMSLWRREKEREKREGGRGKEMSDRERASKREDV